MGSVLLVRGKMVGFYSSCALFLCTCMSALFGAIKVGDAYFQTTNVDAAGVIDDTNYPLIAAAGKVSATKNLETPYRIRAWMGGAMLWATGVKEEDSSNGYFVARNVPPSNVWPAEVFQQAAVIADPIIFSYSEPPGITGMNHSARGINITSPYPYLKPDAPYGTQCQTADPHWKTAPLTVETDPLPMILLYPSTTEPTDGVKSDDTIWGPDAILVDRMGDWDTDLIYQNPSSPYVKTAFSDMTGEGEYIKYTVVQGSPFVFVECRGVEYIVISNRLTTSATPATANLLVPATAGAPLTGTTKIDYVRFGGNQVDPAQFSETETLNPISRQDNFTTYALYFKNDVGITFTPGTATTEPQNSYIKLPNTTSKFYFVIAAIPTIRDYPTTGSTYAASIAMAGNDVDAYAQALGEYAFNFITGTQVSYEVSEQTFLDTTYTYTFGHPYGTDSTVVTDSAKTIACLMPHHYQGQTFDTGFTPAVLTGTTDFAPTNTSNLKYWTVRGDLKAILGGSFTTNYIFSNFLATMPPPQWTDCVTLSKPNKDIPIGQLLFDSIDNEYINNLTDPNFAPWNTAYFKQNKGVYDVGKSLSKAGKQLGLILEFLQGLEENTIISDTYNRFFYSGTDITNFQTCSSYANQVCPASPTSDPQDVLYEQQYNNHAGRPDRPGAFNPQSFTKPVKERVPALQGALQSSIIGDAVTNPPISGLGGAISHYFDERPYQTQGGYNLSHFAFYDPIVHMVMLYPSAGTPPAANTDPTSPTVVTPWPSRVSGPANLPNHYGPGIVLESFGVANAFNDHHYQYAYWIQAAAYATLYDGAWKTAPDGGSGWGTANQYGTAIDQLVKDICYLKNSNPADSGNPDIAFYSDPSMTFAHLNFFDQWAGHGWADGLQATIAGGNSGHNENSIGEALQAYAAIVMWGIATGRKDVRDLGIYLYTTCAYAMDAYFFDKNLNYSKASSFFNPTVTKVGDPTYTLGDAFIDYTIHSGGGTPTSSGTPKISQGVLNYSADFGQTPLNVKLINAFPVGSWALVFGRNKEYLSAWNASMDTTEFTATIPTGITTENACWTTNFDANMNMLRMLGGDMIAFGQKDLSASAPTPLEFMLDVFTQWGPCPPWGSQGAEFADPCQSINETLHFMHVLDAYGTPDWKVYGRGFTDSDSLLFTAAFKKGGTTSAFAFNPTLADIEVQFYKVEDKTAIGSSFTVKAKRWASTTFTSP